LLRWPHGHHRDIPAWLLAALPAGGIHRRNQDRYIMIKVGARQNCKTARLLRQLSTGNDHARPRAALNSRRVVRSPLCDVNSASRDRPTGFVTAAIDSQTSVQPTSATDRQ